MVNRMAEKRFHGVRVTENTDLVTAINDVDSSVIGIAVADDADTGQFPLNKPVLITRVSSVLGKAGKAGTLYKALKAISDQVSTRVIVVRVEAAKEGAENKTQDQLVIGTTEEDGSYSGMQALLVAEQMEGIGYRPRILAAPGLESDAVTAALVTVAGKMRAFAYSGCPGCTKPSDAIAFRKRFPVAKSCFCGLISLRSTRCPVKTKPSRLRRMRAVFVPDSTMNRAGIAPFLTCL